MRGLRRVVALACAAMLIALPASATPGETTVPTQRFEFSFVLDGVDVENTWFDLSVRGDGTFKAALRPAPETPGLVVGQPGGVSADYCVTFQLAPECTGISWIQPEMTRAIGALGPVFALNQSGGAYTHIRWDDSSLYRFDCSWDPRSVFLGPVVVGGACFLTPVLGSNGILLGSQTGCSLLCGGDPYGVLVHNYVAVPV